MTTETTETAITDMGLFKDWLKVEYATLTRSVNLLERQHNSQGYSYHCKRLELIKVARTIGLELVNQPSLKSVSNEEK